MIYLMDRRIQRNSLNEEGTQRAFVAVKGFVLEVTQTRRSSQGIYGEFDGP